jgi:hypothetical protein
MKIPCNACGRDIDERSIRVRKVGGKGIDLCLACDGYYTDKDLREKMEAGEFDK